MSTNGRVRNQPAPWLYLWGVLAWTWCFWGAAALTRQFWLEFPTLLLAIAGGLGPIVVPALLIHLGYWDKQLDPTAGHFLRRVFDPRTLAARGYFWVLGLVLVLAFGPVLLDPAMLRAQGVLELGPGMFLLVGLLGALEEPGWRGYAQEGLQRRMSILAASLVIGVFWAAWHLPLFFIPGTYQAGLGIGTSPFWGFHLALVVGSPVYAWLYNATGRVPFSAVFYHGLSNIAREIAPDTSTASALAVEAGLAILLVLLAWRWMRAPAHTPAGKRQLDS